MQTLPANGQAQPLPAKWVIKVTPENKPMLIEWANKQADAGPHDHWNTPDEWYMHSEWVRYGDGSLVTDIQMDGFVEITDSQFKAMVEGEDIIPDMVKRSNRHNELMSAYLRLEAAGEHDLAAALKAKHPDIWPVDYAAKILQSSIDVYRLCYEREKPENYIPEMQTWMEDCRNYLTNQK